MDNQHRKISGYRELTQQEIDLMNEIKALGIQLEAVCNKVVEHINTQWDVCVDDDDHAEMDRIDKCESYKWESTGRQKLQEGLMNLTRAVAQPTFF